MGDVLVACCRCDTVSVLAETYEFSEAQILAIPAGGSLPFERPCEACAEPREFRVLSGPLHVPRPNGELPQDKLDLIASLKDALEEIRRLKGLAWVGSRIPYERDPDYLSCKATEARIEAAIAKAVRA